MLNFIKKYKLVLILIIVVVVLLVLRFFLQKNKPLGPTIKKPAPLELEKEKKFTTPSGSPSVLSHIKEPINLKNSFNKFNFSQAKLILNPTINFPNKLSVFEIQVNDLNNQCQQIAQVLKLNFVPVPVGKKSNTGLWTNNSSSLLCDPTKNRLEIDFPLTITQKPNLEKIINASQDLMKKIGFDISRFSLKMDAIEYYQATGQSYLPSSLDKADMIGLKYQQNINNFPILQFYDNSFPLQITGANAGSIIKLVYFPVDSQSLKEQGIYPLVDPKEAITRINQGREQILSLKYQTVEGPTYYADIPLGSGTINNASFSKIQLVYFFSPEEKKIIPAYYLFGTGIVNNKKVDVSVLVVAISSEYLNR